MRHENLLSNYSYSFDVCLSCICSITLRYIVLILIRTHTCECIYGPGLSHKKINLKVYTVNHSNITKSRILRLRLKFTIHKFFITINFRYSLKGTDSTQCIGHCKD